MYKATSYLFLTILSFEFTVGRDVQQLKCIIIDTRLLETGNVIEVTWPSSFNISSYLS